MTTPIFDVHIAAGAVMSTTQETAFPRLSAAELAVIKPLASFHDYADGETIFRAGQADIDLFVVESGQIDILNPADGDRVIVTHDAGQFSGDIDLMTGRSGDRDRGGSGHVACLHVPGGHLRSLLNRVPSLGEKLIVAFTRRRELLSHLGVFGLRVVGPGRCRDTNTVREFLYKNFVPFTWFDPETDQGRSVFRRSASPQDAGYRIAADGRVLLNPSLQELARAVGTWKGCPGQEVDFAIVGAGPAGLAAAVYASSEGLSTLMLDRLGPGGQVGGTSRIENFIGFPAGLSGADLAMRGVLQMLKFGAGLSPLLRSRSWSRPDLPVVSMCCIWIAVRKFAVVSFCSPSGFSGDGLRPVEQIALLERESIMPVRLSKLTCMTAQMLRSSAPATRPDRPSCSWPNAVRLAKCICSSVARWGQECPNTWRNGFGQRQMWWSTNRRKSRR